jgi:hypothetical protein
MVALCSRLSTVYLHQPTDGPEAERVIGGWIGF